MIIYNVTTKVTHAIAAGWLQWMKEEYIPAMVATGCFTSGRILQLLEADETEGLTYAVQYTAESEKLYNQYISAFAENIKQKAFTKWGDQFISFSSVLAVVH